MDNETEVGGDEIAEDYDIRYYGGSQIQDFYDSRSEGFDILEQAYPGEPLIFAYDYIVKLPAEMDSILDEGWTIRRIIPLQV